MSTLREPPYEMIEHTKTRLAVGERVSRSTREKPTFRMWAEVDAGRLVAGREARKKGGQEPVPTYNDLLIYLVARVLPRHPRFNAWYEETGLRSFKVVNLGFAVATEAGVMLPTLYDADKKSLEEIAVEAKQLTEQARAGRLRASLQMNAGFTISNIGPVAIDGFDAIISPPQTAILAIGPLADRPKVVNGKLEIRPTLSLVLTVDHRAADGAEAARFLVDIRQAIERWEV
jgi:pyruvate dehydrogenase E2 component (dihydrolipoamide acetyltransferase)